MLILKQGLDEFIQEVVRSKSGAEVQCFMQSVG
jgi:hypothetical protein